MEFKDLLRTQRLRIGKTMEQIGAEVGVSKATVQRWESGEIKNVRRDKIAKLAKALDTTPAYLMGWDVAEPTPSAENVIPLPSTRRVPLLGTIACGTPILAEENVEELVDCPDFVHATFALRCKGDSMIGARILDGDIVYIRQQPDVDNGEIAAVLIEGEATLKRVYKSPGQLVLQPENPKFSPLVYSGETLDHIRILGKAVYFVSPVT